MSNATATEERLDTVICVYGDAVEQAIRDTYYAVNGEDFPEDDAVARMDAYREQLAEHFNGCYAGWVADSGKPEEPCFAHGCEFNCPNCPAIEGNQIPTYNPSDDFDVFEQIEELIRLIKCDKSGTRYLDEEGWVLELFMDQDEY